MTAIVDSSFIYALYNSIDSHHDIADAFAKNYSGTTYVPDVILPEVCYLFRRDFGQIGVQRFLNQFKGINAQFVSLSRSDLARIHEIAATYASAGFDIVDCCIMALAERLGVTRIATFDRRDFSIFRPRHCDFLELLPAQ